MNKISLVNTNIYINARFLTQQKSGVQQFAIELSKELLKINPNINFIAPKNIINTNLAKELNVKTYGNHIGQAWEQLELPIFLQKKGKPLLINLCNSAPLNYSNSIITLHDLAFIENPKWFSYSFRKWYNFLIPRIAKKTKHILTVSEFSKTEIQNKLNIKTDNITVTYNGLSSKLINNQETSIQNYTNRKFILTVGSINPRKNLKPLIEAFELLNLNGYDLLIVGGKDQNFSKENLKTKNESIKFLNYLPDNELWSLYKDASLFVYPSLYEGFGIPILEALFFDCQVLVNDLPVYKELYPTFKINFTEGNKTKDYVKSIPEVIKKIVTQKKNTNDKKSLYSYQKSALKLNELINIYA